MVRARQHKDIDLTFKVHPFTSEVSALKNDRAINRSLLNVMSFVQKDRPFDHERVANVRNLLFEPVSPAASMTIKERIRMAIKNMEPRVRIEKIRVAPDIESNRYLIVIQYMIRTTNERSEFRHILRRTG